MKPLKIVLWIVAVSQWVLGLLCLLAPQQFFTAMGLASPPDDNRYMIAMLSARFLAYGFGMMYLARQQEPSRFWLGNMVLIQVIDLAAGIYYTAEGSVTLATSAFPMFNAAVFIALLVWFMPRSARKRMQVYAAPSR